MRKSIVRKILFYRFEKKGFCSDKGMWGERGKPCGTRDNLTTALKHPHPSSRQVPPRPCRGRPPRSRAASGGHRGIVFRFGFADGFYNFKLGFVGEFVRREKPSPSRLRRATSPGVRGSNKRLPLRGSSRRRRVRGAFKLTAKPKFERPSPPFALPRKCHLF